MKLYFSLSLAFAALALSALQRTIIGARAAQQTSIVLASPERVAVAAEAGEEEK